MKHPPGPGGQPGQDEYDGDGDTFEKAAHAAWEEAKKKGKTPQWFEVKKTWIYLENPIGEYKIRIKG